MTRLINRHIFREMLIPFALCLTVFTSIFLMARIIQLTEAMVNKGMGLIDIIKLFVFATPYFFMFTIPMAVLFSVVLCFIKLSSDNEITAIKAAGISLYQLLPPVLAISIIGFGMNIAISTWLLPRANTALADHIFAMASSRADVVVKERLFIDDFPGLTLYIDKIDPRTREMLKIFIADEREEDTSQVIVAHKGVMLRDPKARALVIRLTDGVIDRHQLTGSTTQTINFDTYDLRIDIAQVAASRKGNRHREELNMTELRAKMEEHKDNKLKYYLYFMVFHERLSVPFACLILGLLGMPLGIQSRFRKASSGLVLGVLGFLSYYLLYSAAKGLGETGLFPPLFGLWLPNVLFGLLSVYLLIRAADERPWMFVELAAELKYRLWDKRRGSR